MKSGANYFIVAKLPIESTDDIDSAIFTFYTEDGVKLTKTYPDDTDIVVSGISFAIPFYQEDTIKFAGKRMYCEVQINYTNKSVQVSELKSFYMSGSVSNSIIDGNTPDIATLKQVEFAVVTGNLHITLPTAGTIYIDGNAIKIRGV